LAGAAAPSASAAVVALATAGAAQSPQSPGVEPAGSDAGAVAGWRIRLVPGVLMMEHGNDPLRMLRELAALGTLVTRVDAAKVPTLVDLDPEVCLLSWQMELHTDAERSAVEHIFEWGEGEFTLSIEPLTPSAATMDGPPGASPSP